MSTRVHGTLDGQDYADTYTLWQKPGRYRYELIVRGEGSVSMRIEALRPAGVPQSAGGWEIIEERSTVRSGSRLSEILTVPDVGGGFDPKVDWVQLRLRIVRVPPTKIVEYEFYMGSAEGGSPPPVTLQP